MYPNGPISHERHHFVFFLEIEQRLQAELAADEHEPSENLPGNQSDTSTEKPSVDHNANDNDDDDDDDDDEFFLPTSSKNLPTAFEICANASYNNKNTKNTNSTRQNTVSNLIKAKFNQTMSSTQRRQTDETVGLDDDDDDDDDDEGYDDQEEILRQVYRHDSLAHRMSSSFTRHLSDCMQNLALETSQHPRGLSSVTQYQNDENDDDDSIEYMYVDDDEEDNDTHKVGECFEMDVFVDHQSPMGNNSMDSIITAPTSNANKTSRPDRRRRKSATSTDAINDALLRVLEGSSGSSCKLSDDDDLLPAEVQIGDIARRMDRRYSRRRSFTNAYAA